MSHACQAICRLSPLDAALTMWFAEKCNMTRLKCCVCHAKWRWRSPKCCACHETCNSFSENLAKVLRLPHTHTQRLPTRYETCWNVTKCHPCHAKRGYTTFDMSKRTRHRHGHTALTRTVADSRERFRTVADANATSSEHTLNPQTTRVKREPLLRIREKTGPTLRRIKMHLSRTGEVVLVASLSLAAWMFTHGREVRNWVNSIIMGFNSNWGLIMLVYQRLPTMLVYQRVTH